MGGGLAFGSQNGDWNSVAEVMKDMMWPYQTGPGRLLWGSHWVFELITWILIIILLIGLIRWIWKKGNSK